MILVHEIELDGQQHDAEGLVFPLALATEGDATLEQSLEWIQGNKDFVMKKLDEHGVVLLRGFPLRNVDHFHDFLMAFEFKFGDYLGGGGPRLQVRGPIHTSTETPPEKEIPFHHELAYLTVFPRGLVFFCEICPIDRGQTPIMNSNRVYEAIKAERPDFIAQVESKGVIYTRLLKSREHCDFKYQRGWQDAFATDDPAEAEKRAHAVGVETVEWQEENAMKVISKVLPGVVVDPRSKKPTWFNSIVLLSPCIQGMKAEESPWSPCYGDGSKIEEADVLAAHSIMQREGTKFNYQQGDVLMVDNKLALHARTAFSGPRRILAAIYE